MIYQLIYRASTQLVDRKTVSQPTGENVPCTGSDRRIDTEGDSIYTGTSVLISGPHVHILIVNYLRDSNPEQAPSNYVLGAVPWNQIDERLSIQIFMKFAKLFSFLKFGDICALLSNSMPGYLVTRQVVTCSRRSDAHKPDPMRVPDVAITYAGALSIFTCDLQ